MNTNIKRLLIGALLLLALANVAKAGYIATPAVGADGKTIYIWVPSGGSGNLPEGASDESTDRDGRPVKQA